MGCFAWAVAQTTESIVTIHMDLSRLSHALMALVCVIYGGMNIVIQWGLPKTVPDTLVGNAASGLAFTLLRDTVSALALALVALPKLRDASVRRMLWNDRGKVLAGSLFFIGGMVPFVMGVALTNAATAVLFQPLVPVLTTALALALGLEPRHALRLLAIVLAVVGTAVTIDPATLSLGSAVGMACLITNALCLPVWLCLLRMMMSRAEPQDPLALMAAVNLAGVPVVGFGCLCFSAATADAGAMGAALGALIATPRSLAAIAYCGLLASALNSFLLNFCAAHLFASVETLWTACQPLATLPLAYLFFGELPSARAAVGCGLIAVALLLCTAVSLREEREALRGKGLLDVPHAAARSAEEQPATSEPPLYQPPDLPSLQPLRSAVTTIG